MATKRAGEGGKDLYGKLTGVIRNDDGSVNHLQYTKTTRRKRVVTGVMPPSPYAGKWGGQGGAYYKNTTPLPPKGKANPYKSRAKKK